MVCIIDDREDVWNMASNLIQVKPYHFFQHTGDINAPPGLSKHELDGEGVDFKGKNHFLWRKRLYLIGLFFFVLTEIDKINEKKPEESTDKELEKTEETDADKGDNTVSSTSKDEESVDVFEMESEAKAVDSPESASTTDIKEPIVNSVDKLNGKAVPEEVDENSAGLPEQDEEANNAKQASDSDDINVTDDLPSDNPKVSNIIINTDKSLPKKEDDESIASSTSGDDRRGPEAENDSAQGSDDVATTSQSSSPNVKITNDGQKQIEIEDPDDYLLYLEVILRNIHKRFYAIYDETTEIPDLKIIVPKIRCEVLRGKNLVFSGLVPTQMKLEQSRAYFIAKSLGAEVRSNISKDITHLVAVNAGTYKVNAAKKEPNIKVVNANWLWACAERWEYVDERLFPLDRKVRNKGRQPPAHCHSPEHVVNYSERSEISPSSSMQQEQGGNFRETLNPLLVFTNADIADMNKDYETFFESDSSSDEGPVNFGKHTNPIFLSVILIYIFNSCRKSSNG